MVDMISLLLAKENLVLLAVSLCWLFYRYQNSTRTHWVRPHVEYVAILGASSGVGRALAVQYARRGARVCIVARNRYALKEVQAECNAASGKDHHMVAAADFSSPDDMIALRGRIEKEWGKLDTLAVIAGVSSLKPVLESVGAGYWKRGKPESLVDAELEGVKDGVHIANAAMQGNFVGPYTAAVTFIPIMSRTSLQPAILLLSSVAAVIPAPTRALYAASKGASLLLYQSLAIEHPDIAFTFVLPGTIEGDFRKSAVDGGIPREADPNSHGLKREVVAQRCIQAVDNEERTVFMGGKYRFGHILYWLWPSFVEKQARAKYNFPLPEDFDDM